ncbi:MAG TPA: crotonyl-CoA carboxylase/reductase [Pseudonocardiaceae bacterium]|nr:crotonyl-CoA carboxylase/reductase [Pseudonocardiaceae bacterium]
MSSTLTEVVRAGGDAGAILDCPLPETYRAAFIRREDENIFAAGDTDRDVRTSLHVGDVPLPPIAPDEVLVAVMASAVNYNTVWSAMFLPISTFRFLDQFARQGSWARRHRQPFHVLGSDAAGVVVRVGEAVRHWSVGDRVVVAPPYIDEQDPIAQSDGMMAGDLRAWGFETNFGAFGHFAVARATQLIAKPRHLSWEEAACNTLCLGTAYRMLISPHGARIKLGDIVLIWGAAGGLGGYAVQLVRQAGGIAVGVISSPDKADLVERLGCQVVLDRHELGLDDGNGSDPELWRRLGSAVRKKVGEDPHVVFEHVGRATFGASLFVVRRGGVVVTCGSSSGYEHVYDNRHLWMRIKRVIGSHGANAQESVEANRLLNLGLVVPTLSRVFDLEDVAEATRCVQTNQHTGKIGVLGLAGREGLGIEDPILREQIGEDRLRLFRDHVTNAVPGSTP